MKRGARRLDDIDLAAAIAAALHVQARAAGITVNVSHGAVTLEGEAESEQQRTRAEDIARQFCAEVTSAVRVREARARSQALPEDRRAWE